MLLEKKEYFDEVQQAWNHLSIQLYSIFSPIIHWSGRFDRGSEEEGLELQSSFPSLPP